MKLNLIVLCLIITVLFTVNSVHSDYPLPFHSEEFDHLNLSKESLKGQIETGKNWEIGFTVLIGVLNSLLLNNLDEFLVFIPIIFGLIMGLSSFLLGRHLFRSNTAGLIFGLFSLMIPSNPAVMGLMFAVPNSLGLALTPLLVYLFLKGTTSKKLAFLFIMLFVLITIIHPAFTLILIPIIVLYLLFNPKMFERNQLKIAIALIALILVFPFFASRIGLEEVSLTHNTFSLISQNMTKVLVWSSITHYNPKFFLADFLGYYVLILGALGTGAITVMRLLIEAKRRQGKHSLIEKEFIVSKHQIILPIGVLLLGALYIHFNLKNYTFFVPYERMFLTLMLFLVLSAAAGLYLGWTAVKNKLEKNSLKPFGIGLIALILFFILTVPFSQQNELYKNIEVSGISSLDWIEEFTPKNSSFIALPSNSLVIRTLTERKIFASPPTRAGIPDDFELENFFIQSCGKKKETIELTKAEYIFGEKEISCKEFNKVYDKKDYKIYKVLN